MFLIITIILMFCAGKQWKKHIENRALYYKAYKEEEEEGVLSATAQLHEDNDTTACRLFGIFLLLGIVFGLIAVGMIAREVFDIMKCYTAPELQVIEYIHYLM